MEAKELIHGDDKKSFVSWTKPEPNCPNTPDLSNPQFTSGRYPVGRHTVTYMYTIGYGFNKHDIECRVNIHVSGKLNFFLLSNDIKQKNT